MKQKLGLQGFYKITCRLPDGTISQQLEFPNLITDLGLNGIGTNGTSWMTSVSLGTGTGAPANGDTALSGTVVSTTTVSAPTGAIVTGPPRYASDTYSATFAQGVATGTWTEVGIGRNSTTLWSRALILDGSGNSTSLTVIAIEQLTVEYQLRCYMNASDVTGNITISGTSHAYTVRPNVDVYPRSLVDGSWMMASVGGVGGPFSVQGNNGALNAAWVDPAGTSFSYTGGLFTVAAYSSTSYTKVCTHTWSVDYGNLSGGITVLRPYLRGDGNNGGAMGFKFGFNAALPKDNTKTMSMTFSYTWSRYT